MVDVQRISIKEIMNHPWFLKNLPMELREMADASSSYHDDANNQPQPIDAILKILEEAKIPPPTPKNLEAFLHDEDEEGQ